MYIHAGVATETFACAPDTSESMYGIDHIAVEYMHQYILCRCVVLRGIAASKKGYYVAYLTYANTVHVNIVN